MSIQSQKLEQSHLRDSDMVYLVEYSNLARIERSAEKQAKSGIENAGWYEKWWETDHIFAWFWLNVFPKVLFIHQCSITGGRNMMPKVGQKKVLTNMEDWMSSPGGRDGVNIMMAVDLFWNGEPLTVFSTSYMAIGVNPYTGGVVLDLQCLSPETSWPYCVFFITAVNFVAYWYVDSHVNWLVNSAEICIWHWHIVCSGTMIGSYSSVGQLDVLYFNSVSTVQTLESCFWFAYTLSARLTVVVDSICIALMFLTGQISGQRQT
jgi:hypothetical protein